MQKITPFLWFDHQAEEAVTFYTSIFSNSKIKSIARYGDEVPGMQEKVLTAVFQLQGQNFMALDGGPEYKFTPAVSFFVNCKAPEEVDTLWEKLSPDGQVMMELDTYPFSPRYGWVQDRFGISWQLSAAPERAPRITPALLFVGDKHGKAEEAINYYTSLFAENPHSTEGAKSSRVNAVAKREKGEPEPEGTIKYSEFSLEGHDFVAMESNADHHFTFSLAISFFVNCENQAEVDYFWDHLADGGKTSQCGWLDDRYGVTWQIIPHILGEYMQDNNKKKASAVMQAMMKMTKIDVAALEQAYRQS